MQLLVDGTMNERAASVKPLLEVKNLKKYFPIKGGIFSKTVGQVYAVDGVSFFVPMWKTSRGSPMIRSTVFLGSREA